MLSMFWSNLYNCICLVMHCAWEGGPHGCQWYPEKLNVVVGWPGSLVVFGSLLAVSVYWHVLVGKHSSVLAQQTNNYKWLVIVSSVNFFVFNMFVLNVDLSTRKITTHCTILACWPNEFFLLGSCWLFLGPCGCLIEPTSKQTSKNKKSTLTNNQHTKHMIKSRDHRNHKIRGESFPKMFH